MSVDKIKEVLMRFYEAINRGDFPALSHLVASDYVEHQPLPPRVPPDREGVQEYVRQMRAAFPDVQYAVQDIVAENDKAWSRVIMTGTQKEEFEGIPPTGKQVRIEQVDIYRFAQNQIIEHWSIIDQLGLLQQLGVYTMIMDADLS